MSHILPVNVEALLSGSSVESQRIEFKANWDADHVGSQVLKTICAFANDYQNINGGYIVIGVEEDGGHAVLPPSGIDPSRIETIQQWIRDQCNRFDSVYQPTMAPEVIDGRHLLVIWAFASDSRPHRAPDRCEGRVQVLDSSWC